MQISLNAHFQSSRYVKGAVAEKAVVKALRKAGFKVIHYRLGGTDIKAVSPNGTITRIEVKYASKGKDGKYRATCYNTNQDASKSDVIVLLCQEPFKGGTLTPFVIPVSSVNSKRIAITSNPITYTGKYAEFRENWIILQ